MIDHDNVVKYAQDHAVPFTNYASLCAAKKVQGLIQSEIDKVNKNSRESKPSSGSPLSTNC